MRPYALLYRSVKKGYLYAGFASALGSRRFQYPSLHYTTNPLKFLITMASYIYENLFDTQVLKPVAACWDMEDYEGIDDFECTTDYRSARRGQSQIMW